MGEMGQVAFAKHLGISQGYLSHILAGDDQHGRPGLTPAAQRILRVYPELARFFLPSDMALEIADALRKHAEEGME